MINVIKQDKILPGDHLVWITGSFHNLPGTIDAEVRDYLGRLEEDDKAQTIHIDRLTHHEFFVKISSKESGWSRKEQYRLAGAAIPVKAHKISKITLVDTTDSGAAVALAEGMVLANYYFDKYKSEKEKEVLESVAIAGKVADEEIKLLNISNEAVWMCRDLGNEPQSVLDAVALADVFRKMAENTGARIEVFNKKKIESLKMGGLLAVNSGSETEPVFTVMEWKPGDAVNQKPVVLVGKGVVFDSGGLNIKTGEFMYDMKLDMAGAAAAATAFYAVAKAALPVWVIALIPATDNRPGKQAYAPGDIIKMHNGKTVEVINTDAEGRLILADALSYAQRYEPQVVIDLATLTGAAARAIGKYGIVAMHNSDFSGFDTLAVSGEEVYERLVEFPMWKEYDELIKSPVADIKNLGGAEAGAITAGKFLQHFVSYPWVHLDIAGPSILSSNDGYRTKGASGTGTRLLFNYILNLAKK